MALNAESVLIGILATWRISNALLREDGPYQICTKIRSAIVNSNNSLLMGLFSCIYCLSFWVGLFTTILILSNLIVVLLPFAFSGGAILVNRYAVGQGSHNRH